MRLYKRHELKPYADRSLRAEFERRQNSAREDDWREGVIEQYLSNKKPGEFTCVAEVFNGCLKADSYAVCSRKDSIDIGKIISQLPDWEKWEKLEVFEGYGRQRCYIKKSLPASVSEGLERVETPEDMPF